LEITRVEEWMKGKQGGERGEKGGKANEYVFALGGSDKCLQGIGGSVPNFPSRKKSLAPPKPITGGVYLRQGGKGGFGRHSLTAGTVPRPRDVCGGDLTDKVYAKNEPMSVWPNSVKASLLRERGGNRRANPSAR